MTKQFIKELERELKTLSPSTRNEILNEYQIHIDEALENGETEAEILKQLGDPKELAEEIIELEGAEVTDTPTKFNSSNVIQDFNPEDIKKIDVTGASLKVSIIQSDRFEMKFHSYFENDLFDYTVHEDELMIQHDDPQNTSSSWSFMDFIRSRPNSRPDQLEIHWPTNLEQLNIKSSIGTVLVDGIASQQFNVDTDMGSIKGKNLIGVNGEFNTNMGSAELKGSTFDVLKLSSNMGKVTVLDTDANSYDLYTDMGKVEAKNLNPNSHIKATTSMGSIDACYKEAPVHTKVVTTSSLGKVKNELPQSMMGDADYLAEFKTDMGTIKISSN